MKIELTKKEYKTLLTMLYCGEWVLNCNKTKSDKMQKDCEGIEQILFPFAKDAGLEKWIEYDEGNKMYFLTPVMEDDLHGFIDKYNNKQKDFY